MTVRGSTLAFSLLFAAAVHAQTTPPPSGAFIPPITGYAGRYLDSAQTPNFQGMPARTLRAQQVKVAPERNQILMKLSGSRFAVYRMDTFAARVASEALATGGHGEKYLPPDVFLAEPEAPGSGWVTPLFDGQDVLFDFDYDDRGYFYLAYSVWGFGIVDSTGTLQAQVNPTAFNVRPLRILAVRAGSSVYAVISDAQPATSVVYDVTNPVTPLFVRSLPFGFGSYAKLASGGVALVSATGQMPIWTSGADLVAGNPPTQIVLSQFFSSYSRVVTDGNSLFASQISGIGFPFNTIVSVLSGAPGSFVETRYAPLVGLAPIDLHYGAGFVVVSGTTFPSTLQRSVYIYPRDSPTPVDEAPYFTAAYPPGAIAVESMAPYEVGRQAYLIAALFGVGDVFTLGAASAAIPAVSPVALLVLIAAFAALALFRLR